MTASISLRGVGRTFGATRALAGVDLDLEPGVIGLLGPNGAGKTPLLRLLATALPPSQGEVRVLGRDPQVRPNAPASAAGWATCRRRSVSRAASPPSRHCGCSCRSRSSPT